ncbi:MAG: ATP-binding protein [Chloroflexi bacterium]|nr:ATP-binding protein [Chloroflexota bacterium]
MTPATEPTFAVSRAGLRKLLDRRGPTLAVTELIQNAWDEDVSAVVVTLEPIAGRRGRQRLVVEDDDPEGFTDLSHAYTLFAESEKRHDPKRRGRFNLGEKFVIALCDEATISTVTGTVVFAGDTRQVFPRRKRERGSRFEGIIEITRDQAAQCAAIVRTLIPPAGVRTTFNGEPIEHREPLRVFEATLETEWAGDDGRMHRNPRRTTVSIYAALPDEQPSLYELGIPVVETGDRWHIDCGQKVPLNIDRDNVTPAYLRALRAEVLNRCHDLLADDDAGEKWIDDALSDRRIEPEAVGAALDKRYGERRVAWDPNDQEANHRATAAGYTVVPSRGLPKGVSARAREHGLLKIAGEVTPSPKPYSDDPNAIARHELPRDKWTPGMHNIAAYAEALAPRLIGRHLARVSMVSDPACRNFAAAYGAGCLDLNVRVLGRAWFERGPSDPVNELLIHEFGHERASNHLSDEYYDALCEIAALFVRLAREDPAFFEPFEFAGAPR